MALYNSSDMQDVSYLLSQTPPNFVEDNYFLKEIQLKVNADWPYRPNRKIIEEEIGEGTEKYEPIEVVVQTIKNDKGSDVSDDWYRVVFKDCRRENRIGKRYRFSYDFNPKGNDSDKNVWIGMNQKTLTPTSSQVICRCNGTLGSIYINESGVSQYHYEPVIQKTDINAPGFDYREVAVDPDGNLVIFAQFNKYTKQYHINQRFIIGDSFVYKVTNIMKYDTRKTYDVNDVGLVKIYLSMDQTGDLDNFDTRIAYNGSSEPLPVKKEEGDYSLAIIEPNSLPSVIPQAGFTFKPSVLLNGEPVSGYTFNCSLSLFGGQSHVASVSDYCTVTDNGDGTFTLVRKRVAPTYFVKIVVSTVIGTKTFEIPFEMSLRPF